MTVIVFWIVLCAFGARLTDVDSSVVERFVMRTQADVVKIYTLLEIVIPIFIRRA